MVLFRKNIQGWFLTAVVALFICLLAACAKYMNPVTTVVAVPGADYIGSEACAVCHEDVFEYFRKTVHYKIAYFEIAGQQRGCESCHGPGSAHVKEGGNIAKIFNFNNLTPAQSSGICLKCHDQGPLMQWRGSLHAMSDVGCNNCHKSHKGSAKKMLYKGDPDLCYDCHQQKRAQAQFPSHHPIREGKMKCNDCHNTHGSDQNGLRAQNVNDLCYDCHTDKQGPFIYEHPPVEEGCSLCHDAHGTIANNLLKQSEPFLCLRCHQGHRGLSLSGTHPSMSSLITSCVQCHSQVHGSDLPSQMGRGTLTR
jgi:DmsE family decaheme c-type cytochrome